MKRFSKFSALILAVALIVCSGVIAYADEFDSADDFTGYDIEDLLDYYKSDASGEYEIEKYDISIVVDEYNTLSVCEKITADFHIPKHGIYRYIPVKGNVKRADGSETTFRTKVSDVRSNAPIYDTYMDGNNYVIQLGEEDATFTGLYDYEISYTYNIGKDTVENADELYYNIIGTGWDTKLSNITFTIEMPKEFDSSKIGFSTGSYGAEGTDIVNFKVKGNTISGRLTKGLDSYEGLTVRIELEDGYFKFDRFAFYSRYVAQIGVSIIALAIVLFLWIKYGRDKKIVEVVEFYPPEGMNCAEVSYWHNGIINPADTVPLMIELANEGYLNIEEIEGRYVFSKNSFRINKIKSYDGDDDIKRKFFNGLFTKGNSVTEKDLKNRFYVTVNDIVRSIPEMERTNVFNRKSLIFRFLGWMVSVIAAAINIVIFGLTAYGIEKDFVVLAVGVGISIVAFICSFFIRQRTDKGHEIKQKIIGFKMFLETSEKERLEALVEENPSYFYDILPYAYVLGVSDKWTKKFESIAMQPPQWYYSPRMTMWDYMVFSHFMHSTMDTASRVFVSTPQNNSGGSHIGGSFGGGGGFSGGGFGGGGGGSW